MRYIEEFLDIKLEDGNRLTFEVKLKRGFIRGARGRMDVRYLADDARAALRKKLIEEGLPLGELAGDLEQRSV